MKVDLLEMLAGSDVQVLLEGLSLLGNDQDRKQVIIAVIPQMAHHEPAKLMEYAREHFEKDDLRRAMLACVGQFSKDGSMEDAATALSLIDTPLARGMAIDTIAFSIAAQNDDTSIALRWAHELPVPAERQRAELAVLATKANKADAASLMQMMGAFHEPRAKTALASTVIEKLAVAGNDAAIQWMNSLPPELSSQLGGKLAVAMARNDLPMATKYTLELANSSQQTSAIDGIARNLYQQGPVRLAEWAAALPPELSDRATSFLARNWIRDDAPHATEWISALPEGVMREKALASAAGAPGVDPAKAEELLSMMKDPAARAYVQAQVKVNARLFNPK